MATENAIDMKFVNAAKRMEARATVRAFAVINPADINNNGRYVISYPANGGTVYAIGWLPGDKSGDTMRHAGQAKGYGYDKGTAAMGGAAFYNLKTGEMDKLVDQGYNTRRQLEQAGYIVIQAV